MWQAATEILKKLTDKVEITYITVAAAIVLHVTEQDIAHPWIKPAYLFLYFVSIFLFAHKLYWISAVRNAKRVALVGLFNELPVYSEKVAVVWFDNAPDIEWVSSYRDIRLAPFLSRGSAQELVNACGMNRPVCRKCGGLVTAEFIKGIFVLSCDPCEVVYATKELEKMMKTAHHRLDSEILKGWNRNSAT